LTDRLARPVLPDVALVAVTSVALAATVDALHASMRQAQFGQILLLSDQPPPPHANAAITWQRIDRLSSRADYSRFMLRDLAGYVGTTHALCVQWDGFVLDGAAWDPHFLDYDYIGAVWPQFRDGRNVGNGGFSLRSRRLLEACTTIPLDGSQVEDLLIGRLYRPLLEEQGVRFAPEPLARRFAYERTTPSGAEFGFHGAFNLVRLLKPAENLELFRKIDRGMLARSERLEILRWAFSHGQVRLALEMFLRLL
jgi:hypothetical protein